MNRILKSFLSIFVMALCLGLQSQVSNAQTGGSEEELEQLVAEMATAINNDCPVDIGNGIRMLSCSSSKTTLSLVVGIPDGIKPSLFTDSDDFKTSFISGLNSSEMPFGTLCGMLGITLKLTLKNNLGQNSISYTPDELVGE